MKHIRTCLLFWRDELDCGLISEKKEGLFVKHPETRVNTQRSQQGSEFSRASNREQSLRNLICFGPILGVFPSLSPKNEQFTKTYENC
jgi:hypothetical protein